MRRRGFTLLELLLVLIVVSLLTATALVSYSKVTERARATEAVQNLSAIRTGEMVYQEEHGIFVEALDNPSINAFFDIGITPRYFDYQVIPTGPGAFVATATAKSVMPDSLVIAMDHTGQISYFYPANASAGSGGASASGSSGVGSGRGSGLGGTVFGGGGLGPMGGGGSEGIGSTGGGSISGGSGSNPIGTLPGSSSGGEGGGSSTTSSDSGDTSSGYTDPLGYIHRGEDSWPAWPDSNASQPNIGGSVGIDRLTEAFRLVSQSDARFITDDILRKDILTLFGQPGDFSAPDTRGAIAYLEDRVFPPKIIFNPVYQDASAGELAAILVHEGTHLGQYIDGSLLSSQYGVVQEDTVRIEFTAWWNAATYWNTVRGQYASSDTPVVNTMEAGWTAAQQGEGALRDLIRSSYHTGRSG